MEVRRHSLKKTKRETVKCNMKIQHNWWFSRTFVAYLLFRAVIVVGKKREVVPPINVSL